MNLGPKKTGSSGCANCGDKIQTLSQTGSVLEADPEVLSPLFGTGRFTTTSIHRRTDASGGWVSTHKSSTILLHSALQELVADGVVDTGAKLIGSWSREPHAHSFESEGMKSRHAAT